MNRTKALALIILVGLAAACGDDGATGTGAKNAAPAATAAPTTAAPTTTAPTTTAAPTTTTAKPVDPATITAKFTPLNEADIGTGFVKSPGLNTPDTVRRQTVSKQLRDDATCAPMADLTVPLIATARYFDSWAQAQPATRITIELHVSDAATTAGVLQIAKSQLPLVTTCTEKQGRIAVPDFTVAFALVPLPSGLPVDGVWVHQTFDSTAVNVHGDLEYLVLVSGSARVEIFQTVNVRGTFNKDEFVRITKLVAQRLADATR